MPIEVVNGRRIHIQTLGRKGPSVAMLHGLFIGTLATWYLTAAPTLARSRRILMYDMPGHGLSERTREGYTMRRMAADLHALLDRFGDRERVSLVGHSYGGAAVLRYALDHPERVDRVVLVEAPLPVITRQWIDDVRRRTKTNVVDTLTPWQKLRVLIGRNRSRQVLSFGAARRMLDESTAAWLPPAQQAVVAGGGRRAERIITQLGDLALRTTLMEDMLVDPDFSDDELARCTVPTLLVYGTKTQAYIAATGRRLAERLPAAQLQWLEGGHQLPWEAAKPLAALIDGFLDA